MGTGVFNFSGNICSFLNLLSIVQGTRLAYLTELAATYMTMLVMKNTFRLLTLLFIWANTGCNTNSKSKYIVPAEFDEQEYIWLSWVESGFLSGEPFYFTAISAMKEITPNVKIRLFYGPQLSCNKEQMENKK